MQTQIFNITYQNVEEKNIMILTLSLGILLSFIPFLATMYMYNGKISEQMMEVVKAFLNFDLILFIIIFVVGALPILGFLDVLISPFFFIINLILILKALSGLNNNQPFEIPVLLKLF